MHCPGQAVLLGRLPRAPEMASGMNLGPIAVSAGSSACTQQGGRKRGGWHPTHHHPSLMTNWITGRLPTRADGDEWGLVLVRHVGLKSSQVLAHWSDLGGAEWRHTSDWTPPTPEPTPAAPGPEPEKATRGFLAFTRVENEHGFTDSAVGTDNTAWVRFCGINHPTSDWMAITPLPQPGEE